MLEMDEGTRAGCVKGGEQRVPFRYFWPDDEHQSGVIANDSREGEWYSQLVYQVARATSCEQPAARPNLAALPTGTERA
jgi:hypothetical protein